MDSKLKKFKVYQFNPVIYPCLLWVIIGNKIDKNRFPSVDLMEEDTLSRTERTNDVLNDNNGVLIRFQNSKVITAEIITHESVHAAMEIMQYVGGKIDVRNQEPFAYLAGWIADCIDKVKKNKFK